MAEPDYYEVLQVQPSAEWEVIEAAYRRLARKYHPDVNKSAEAGQRMRELNAAYEVLCNPIFRRDYDRRRGSYGGFVSPEPTADPAVTEQPSTSQRKTAWKPQGLPANFYSTPGTRPAAHSHAGEAPLPEFSFSFGFNAIAILLAAGLVVRLGLAFLPGFNVDMGVFTFWSIQLAEKGPWHFYDEDFFTDYAPGYMYVLLLIGKLREWFSLSDGQVEYVLKLPSIAADLASAYLLYRLLDTRRLEVRLGAAALYLLFPAALLIGAVWGQVDSMLAFFLLLSVYYIGRERPVAGAVAFTAGFLVKPQAIAALPFLALWIMRQRPPEWREVASGIRLPVPPAVWYKCAGAGVAVLLVLIFPFFTYKPWDLISQLYDATNVENYRTNSFWAYNFWNLGGLFDWGFKPDVAGIKPGEGEWMGFSHRLWGTMMFAASTVLILIATRRSKGTGMLALGTALSVLAFFLFLTRMHERYAFAVFLPFLAACALLESRLLWASFAGLSLVHFFNLYHVYVYYNPNGLRWESFYALFGKADFLGTGLETVQVLSIIMVASFPVLLAAAYVLSVRSEQEEAA